MPRPKPQRAGVALVGGERGVGLVSGLTPVERAAWQRLFAWITAQMLLGWREAHTGAARAVVGSDLSERLCTSNG